METYLGFIYPTTINFNVRNFASCDGQIVSISEFQALYAVTGVAFGGDGRVNFGLPDLRGRVAKGQGYGPGLYPTYTGYMGGLERHTLSIAEMPSHDHETSYHAGVSPGASVHNLKLQVAKGGTATETATTTNRIGGENNPAQAGVMSGEAKIFKDSPSDFVEMDCITGSVEGGGFDPQALVVKTNGASSPFFLLNPYTTVRYQIALDGLFPPRN